MFYCNSLFLFNKNMMKAVMQAFRVLQRLEGIVFFDLNLALGIERRNKINDQGSLEMKDIIEIMKEEFEFLWGNYLVEEFNAKNNAISKFFPFKQILDDFTLISSFLLSR